MVKTSTPDRCIGIGFMHKLPRLKVLWRHEYLIEKCTGKKVLHLGAVDYHKGEVCGLHRMLTEVADWVIGLDIDRTGIELAKANGIQNIYYGDLERLPELKISNDFDTILAGEVIEHLANPGLFLAGVKRFFGSCTEMIITTPNVFYLQRFFLALVGREYVHPEHICYYSYTTLRYLLESHGFVVKEEFAYLLENKLGNFRKLLSEINLNFASGLIFVVKI